jgi:GT2 family glycosyltransferase
MILNQDMYLESTAVEEMIKFMDTHSQCGIGTPLQLHPKNRDYVICAGSYEAFPFGKHQHGELSNFSDDSKLYWGNGACMIFRKEMVQEIGLLDKNLVFLGSDSDYCFTARSRGWEVWRIFQARGVHEHGASGAVSDLNIGIQKLNDMIYFGEKWLTGDLYKKLAYDGNDITPRKIAEAMNRLENSKMDKLIRAKKELEVG